MENINLRRIFLVAFFSVTLVLAKASTIDTVSTFSPSMLKKIKAVVITPDNYSKEPLPVIYLLHGYSGMYKDWISMVPQLSDYVDQYNMIIVCPDGGFNSWYLDSPVDSTVKYETYITSELVDWVDSRYHTIRSPKGRAITGLSMGGHGALYLAFKHQDVFGAAGSMSGGVDLRPFPKNWDLSKKLGPYAEEPERWNNHSVVNLTHLLTPRSLKLIIDCGKDDFFFDINLRLHRKLLKRNIAHDFIIRPGKHDWAYWKNAIKFQLLFMCNFFST